MKKKLLAVALVAAMGLSLAACGQKAEEPKAEPAATEEEASEAAEEEATEEAAEETKDFGGQQLVVCTWGGSTGAATKALAEEFEQMYNCEIVIDEVNSNSDRITKLQAQIDSGNLEDDVVYLSGAFAKQAEALDLVEPIDTAIVDNMDELYDFAQNPTGFGPMVCCGRFGIMYNANILEEKGLEPPTSYADLLDDKYAGLVSLPAMTATAGPYVLAMLGDGTLEGYQTGLDLIAEKKDNIGLWYTSDIVPALTNGDIAITVYMDLMMPVLNANEDLNMVWVDAAEGNFVDDVYIDVVKGCENKELAMMFIKYALSKETQEKFIELNSEAPSNKTAEMSEEKDAYLVYGQDEFDKCNFWDYNVLNTIKPEIIEAWQKVVGQ